MTQNLDYTCPTRPLGDNSNACASTAFVQSSIQGAAGNTIFSAQTGGNTNSSSSGSGADFDHDLTYTIPTSAMTTNRVFRITIHYQLTTGAAPPSLTHKLKLGSVTLSSSSGATPGPNLNNVQTGLQFFFQATGAPSTSSDVQCAAVESQNALGTAGGSITPMPVQINTSAPQVLKVSTQWNAPGTGTNTIKLNQMIVESLN